MEHNFAECCLREWSAKLNTRTFKSRVFEFLEVSDVVCSLLYLHSHQSVFPCPFHSMLKKFEYHFFKTQQDVCRMREHASDVQNIFFLKTLIECNRISSQVNSAHAGQIEWGGIQKLRRQERVGESLTVSGQSNVYTCKMNVFF